MGNMITCKHLNELKKGVGIVLGKLLKASDIDPIYLSFFLECNEEKAEEFYGFMCNLIEGNFDGHRISIKPDDMKKTNHFLLKYKQLVEDYKMTI